MSNALGALVDGCLGVVSVVLRHALWFALPLLAVLAVTFVSGPRPGLPDWWPAWLRTSIPPPPDMVMAPVATRAIAPGEIIDNSGCRVMDTARCMTRLERVVRAELDGKATQTLEVEQRIATKVLARGQPIPTDAVEPYVKIPVATQPQASGSVIGAGHPGFEPRAVPYSQATKDVVTDLNTLDHKLVVNPIPAGEPVPLDSVSDFVEVPVLVSAMPARTTIADADVISRRVPVADVRQKLAEFALLKTDVVGKSAKHNLEPNMPIESSALAPP